MNRKLIIAILAGLGLTASAAVAEPTGVSPSEEDMVARKNTPEATASDSGSRGAMAVTRTSFANTEIHPEGPAYAGSGSSEPQPARPHRSNSPHPAMQSYAHPVYPIGVPLPPVSLERY